MFENPYMNQYVNPYQRPQQLIRVTGIEGAKAYQMSANSSVALFDENSDVFFVKTTDGAGFPSIRAFSFKPMESPAPSTEFVTRAEFEELKEALKNGKQFVSRKSKSTDEPYPDA